MSFSPSSPTRTGHAPTLRHPAACSRSDWGGDPFSETNSPSRTARDDMSGGEAAHQGHCSRSEGIRCFLQGSHDSERSPRKLEQTRFHLLSWPFASTSPSIRYRSRTMRAVEVTLSESPRGCHALAMSGGKTKALMHVWRASSYDTRSNFSQFDLLLFGFLPGMKNHTSPCSSEALRCRRGGSPTSGHCVTRRISARPPYRTTSCKNRTEMRGCIDPRFPLTRHSVSMVGGLVAPPVVAQ